MSYALFPFMRAWLYDDAPIAAMVGSFLERLIMKLNMRSTASFRTKTFLPTSTGSSVTVLYH